jgi:hypothetical protein
VGNDTRRKTTVFRDADFSGDITDHSSEVSPGAEVEHTSADSDLAYLRSVDATASRN